VHLDGKQGFILADQLRTADYHRMRKKVATIDAVTLAAALAVLREMFEE